MARRLSIRADQLLVRRTTTDATFVAGGGIVTPDNVRKLRDDGVIVAVGAGVAAAEPELRPGVWCCWPAMAGRGCPFELEEAPDGSLARGAACLKPHEAAYVVLPCESVLLFETTVSDNAPVVVNGVLEYAAALTKKEACRAN